jgi:hypothetical protein
MRAFTALTAGQTQAYDLGRRQPPAGCLRRHIGRCLVLGAVPVALGDLDALVDVELTFDSLRLHVFRLVARASGGGPGAPRGEVAPAGLGGLCDFRVGCHPPPRAVCASDCGRTLRFMTTTMKASEVEPEANGALGEEERIAALAKLPVGYNVGENAVEIRLLRPARRNPRRGAVAEQIESLREFGQHRAAVITRAGDVVIGNHMLKAALQLGWKNLDCFLTEDDEETALRRAITDNAVGDKATWDEAELAEVLDEIGAVPGIEQSEIDKLLAKLAPAAEKAEPTYPLVPRLNEHYDYVFVFCENETDWAWLQTTFDLRKEKSYKSSAVAKSHVVSVERLQELWERR